MRNTTLLIDEKEKENARALTQSFVRADIKSRAYVNALGAEAWLKYLEDEGINSEKTYNMHNIRKILEEFDISDVMLSNIHIDVRVVYSENEIFIPKSHFEYNITPDIYVVLKINKDYSETEFLGFFEPKMINKNNSNDEYYFIEKEKLSSPSDLKGYIEAFKGNYDSDISDSDIETAESLIMSMSDHNISEADKKTLLNYLKANTGLRDRFIEFENFEMLSYQTVNTEEMKALLSGVSDTEEVSDTSGIEGAFDGADFGTAPEAEDVSVAINEFSDMTESVDNQQVEDALDSFAGDLPETTETDIGASLDEFAESAEVAADDLGAALDEFSENAESSDGNAIGDMLAGGAVLGAEIAGAAVASAAIAGGVEAVKDAAMAADVVAGAADMLAEGLSGNETNDVTESGETKDVNEVESTASDGLIDNIDVDALSMEAGLAESSSTGAAETVVADGTMDFVDSLAGVTEDATVEESMDFVDALSETAEETPVQETTDFTGELTGVSEETTTDTADFTDAAGSFDEGLFGNTDDTASSDDLFGATDDSPAGNFDLDSSDLEVSYDNDDGLEFSDNADFGDLTFDENSSNESVSFNGNSGSGHLGAGSPGISTVVNTPISEATDLVSMESIQAEMLERMSLPSEEPGALMETMEMDEFNELVDNFVPQKVEDQSEVTEFSAIEKDVDKDSVNSFIPSDVDAALFTDVDKSNSDDFVQAMPEEVGSDIPVTKDDLSSDNFVEDMPEEVEPTQYPSEVSSDDFVADLNTIMDGAPEKDGQDVEVPVQEVNTAPDEATEAEKELPAADSVDDIEALALNESGVNMPEDSAPQSLDDLGDINTDLFAQAESDATVAQADVAAETQSLDESGVNIPEDSAPQSLDDLGDINTDLFAQADLDETVAQPDTVAENEVLNETTVQSDTVTEKPVLDESNLSNPEDIASDGLDALLGESSDLFDQADLDATVAQPVLETNNLSETSAEVAAEDVTVPSEDKLEDVSLDEFIPEDNTGVGEEQVAESVVEAPAANTEGESASQTIEESSVVSETTSEEKGLAEDINDFSELSGLDALDDVSENSAVPEPELAALKGNTSEGIVEDGALGVLYSADNAPEQMVSPLPQELMQRVDENNDFRPKKNNIVLPVAAALIVTLIAGSIVGFMMSSKNSVESETLIQTSPENGTLANPETDNSGVLSDEVADNNGIEPAVPENPEEDLSDPSAANVVAPTENDSNISQAAKQEAIKNTKNAIENTNETIKQNAAQAEAPKKPLNANKTITLQKLSWEVPNYLSYSDNIKTYLQTAGKSIKLTLSSDLLLTSDYIYSNKVKVNLQLDNAGNIKASQITQSSGSTEVDKIVLQTVKDTLNVVKPAAGEVPTPTYNLGLIIYL